MDRLFSPIVKLAKCIGFVDAYKYWVIFGAVSGGALSGIRKMGEICGEPTPVYTNPDLEVPIRGVYQTTRIAGHAGWGSAIGGITAASAPLSIPLYIYWKNQ